MVVEGEEAPGEDQMWAWLKEMFAKRPLNRDVDELLKALEGQVDAAFYGNLQTLHAFCCEADRSLDVLRAAGWTKDQIRACIRASPSARVYLDAEVRRVLVLKVRDAEGLHGPVATLGYILDASDLAPAQPSSGQPGVTPAGRTAGV